VNRTPQLALDLAGIIQMMSEAGEDGAKPVFGLFSQV